MKYYVYFDSYRRPSKAISEQDLEREYKNSADAFLKAMCSLEPDAPIERTVGHVGVLRFDDEHDLQAYMEATGEEITGFYECREDCRPYNF
jgi:hypothetical protein